MARAEQTLSDIEPFKDLPLRDLEALARRCRWRQFAPHQQIVGHQEETRDVFFIARGHVRVTLYSLLGKEVTFRDLDAGEMFGELAAIDGQPRSANVVALTNTLLASMSANEFWEVLRDYPAVAAATLRRLALHVRDLSERVFEFSTLAVKNRIHAELLRLARRHPEVDNTAAISPAPTHTDIANRISTHREAVTRELNDLARAGLLERRPKTLIIRDVSKLARMVQQILGE